MAKYDGEGSGEVLTWEHDGKPLFRGRSKESIDDAIRAAVHNSDVVDGTTLVVDHIEVTTKGDPHVSEYIVVLTPGSLPGGSAGG